MDIRDSDLEGLCRRAAEDYQRVDESYHGDSRDCRNLSSLKLCRKCFELYGPIQLEDRQTVEQTCFCDIPKSEEPWVVDGRFVKDFNQEYEMCYCCGVAAMTSGSRYSSFYCEECKQRIRKVNELVRRCMMPCGRHSIMNGVSIKGESAEDSKAVAAFAAGVNEMNDRIDVVRTHRARIARKQAERFQLGLDEPIIALVLRSHGVDLNELKREAFFDLIALVFGRTTDEARRFYEEVYGQ